MPFLLDGTWPPRVGSEAQAWPTGSHGEERNGLCGDRGQAGYGHERKAGPFLGHVPLFLALTPQMSHSSHGGKHVRGELSETILGQGAGAKEEKNGSVDTTLN